MQQAEEAARQEPEVLSDASLSALAQAVGAEGLCLAMYLNIPTTTLVRGQIRCQEKGQSELQLVEQALTYWKQMRLTAKSKDKVADLARAVRMLPEKEEWANTIVERYKDNLDLTADLFTT